MKSKIITVLVVILVLAGLLIAAPSFINWSKYKLLITARLQEATGYKVQIGGALDMRLLPSPHLVVENLSVAPPHASIPLLMLDRAEITVGLLPLLGGHVIVDSIALVKPQIDLEVGEDGKSTWMTKQIQDKLNGPSTPAGQKNIGNDVALRQIYIKDATVRYKDRHSGKEWAIDNADMAIHGDTLLGPYDAQGTIEYNKKIIKLSVKTGKIESGADSVSLQTEASIAGLATLSYAGVYGLKAHDLQGQTNLNAGSIKKLLDYLNGGQAAPALDKSLRAQGMLTYAADHAGLSNFKIHFGDVGLSGTVQVHNIGQGARAPLDASIALVADNAVNLTPWLPVPAAGLPGEKTPAPKASPSGDFLPATLTIPMPVTLTADIAAPSLQIRGLTLKGFVLTGAYKDQNATGTLKASLPGGSVSTSFTLAYGSSSRAASGALVLADPDFSYDTQLKTGDGAQAIMPFLPADKAKNLEPLLKGPFELAASGGIKGRTVKVDKATVTVIGSTIGLKGSYSPGGHQGRDALVLAAAADRLDADQWLARLSPDAGQTPPPAAPAAANKPAPNAIRENARKLVLPFDLDLTVTADTLRWKKSDYRKFSLLATLAGPALNLKTLQVDDPEGNSILAAGTIGNLATLASLDLSVQGHTRDLKTLMTNYDAKYKTLPDSLQDADLVSEVKGSADAVDFTANVKAMGGTLDASGSLGGVLDKPALTALTVRVRHPSFVDVAKLFSPDFTASVGIKKTLDLFASVKRDKAVYTFTDLQGDIGPASFSGEMTADVSGAKPVVKARLQASNVPLSDLIGHGGRTGNTLNPDAPSETGAQGHWSRDPVNAEWLRKYDVSLTAAIKSLSYGTWKLDNGVADIALKDGVLTLAKLTGGLYGGQLSLSGKMTAPDKPQGPLTISGKADLQGVALDQFVNSFSASHLVSAHGAVNLTTDIQTSGESPAALVGALGGKGTASGKAITFEGFDLVRFSKTLVAPSSSIKGDISSLLGSTMQSGSTVFDTLASSFTIDKGVVTIGTLKLTGPAATVSAPGTVDLPLWHVDMEASVQLTDPKDAPPLKVGIKGPLDQPAKAFGKSALDAYFGTKLQSLIGNALVKKSLGTNAATPLTVPGSTAPSSGDTGKVKPKDILNDVLQSLKDQQQKQGQ